MQKGGDTLGGKGTKEGRRDKKTNEAQGEKVLSTMERGG